MVAPLVTVMMKSCSQSELLHTIPETNGDIQYFYGFAPLLLYMKGTKQKVIKLLRTSFYEFKIKLSKSVTAYDSASHSGCKIDASLSIFYCVCDVRGII